jgi:hypothetical protein
LDKLEYFNKPTFDPLKVYVHPKGEEPGFFIVPPSYNEDGHDLLDEYGFPTAKSLGLFYFTVNTQVKQDRDVSTLRWTRWNIFNSYTGEMQEVYEGDLVKVVWQDGLVDKPTIYKVQYMAHPEGRYCLMFGGEELDYIPIAEFEEHLNTGVREAKSMQVIGSALSTT